MTACQFSESNIIGYLSSGITATDTTIKVSFYDKVSGVPRIPQATTLLFVIDKGSQNAPNSNYELILASSHATVSGVTTITVASNGRGLYWYGNSLTGSGTGVAHVANAEVGCADCHYLWNILSNKLSGGEALGAALNYDVRPVYSGAGVIGARVFADATARNAAITSPQNGDLCYLTSTGQLQCYLAGAWVDQASGGTFPNGTETVAGKWQGATTTDMASATDVGTTGSHLIPMNKNLVKTSSGAGDENKIAILNGSGKFADGFQNLTLANATTLTGAGDASALHNHNTTYPTPISEAGTGSTGNFTASGNLDISIAPFTSANTLKLDISLLVEAVNDDTSDQSKTDFYYFTGILSGNFGGWYCTTTSASTTPPIAFTVNPSMYSGTGSTSTVAASGTGNTTVSVAAPTMSTTNLRLAYTYSKTGGTGGGVSHGAITASVTATKLR